MTKDTQEKLACSLTAHTTELIPFLPYLLGDLWELGSCPEVMVNLIKKHMPLSGDTKILDLACGKGAVSVRVAQQLGVRVYGFDLLDDFIAFAGQKAAELGVSSLCHFAAGDANEVVSRESGYDLTIFGAAGNILGTPAETLQKLAKTVKPGGYILIDEGYLPDGGDNAAVKYQNYDYLTRAQWMRLFEDSGLTLVEEVKAEAKDYDFERDNNAIRARADELIAKYPEKREIFEGYVRSQLDECEDLEHTIIAITWMLQRR